MLISNSWLIGLSLAQSSTTKAIDVVEFNADFEVDNYRQGKEEMLVSSSLSQTCKSICMKLKFLIHNLCGNRNGIWFSKAINSIEIYKPSNIHTLECLPISWRSPKRLPTTLLTIHTQHIAHYLTTRLNKH